jgi:hypothetical protein
MCCYENNLYAICNTLQRVYISEMSTIKRDISECRLVELGVSDLTGHLFEVI